MLDNIVDRTLALVLAGGEGNRLQPLTSERAKPAVPFGGKYRIIDFVLSNIFHSGIKRTYVLTQYKPRSLIEHLGLAWNYGTFMRQHGGMFIDHFDADMVLDAQGYKFEGTADAVRRSVAAITELSPVPEFLLVLSGDHVYKADYSTMLRFHEERGADVTLSTITVKPEEAYQFGIVNVSGDQITGFIEKPKDLAILDRRQKILASMGVYVFNTKFLLEELARGGNDFGNDLLPRMVDESKQVCAYDFSEHNQIRERMFSTESGRRVVTEVDNAPDSAYWRDVGTLRAYWEANMDLVGIKPEFNLYGERHPIITYQNQNLPPFKIVHNDPNDIRYINGERRERIGMLLNSIIGDGSIISGSYVDHCVAGRSVIVHSWAKVEKSVLFDDANVGRECSIRNAIIDKSAEIEERVMLGYDMIADQSLNVVDKFTGRKLELKFDRYNGNYIVAVPKNARVSL